MLSRLFIIGFLLSFRLMAIPTLDQIGLKEGLSQSEVRTILQDKEGYIWFGTQNGLNRYDGSQIQHFYNNPFEKNTLSSDDVTFLYEDSKQKIWVGTKHGLNSFNKVSKDFERYTDLFGKNKPDYTYIVTGIAEDQQKTIWVTTYDGLWRLIPKGNTYKAIHFKYDSTNINGLPSYGAGYIVKDKKGNLWITTRYGLSKIVIKDTSKQPEQQDVTFTHVKNSAQEFYKKLNFPIQRIFCDAQNNLWIAAQEKLFRLNLNTSELSDFSEQLAETNAFISSVIVDRFGTLWLGTIARGVFRYQLQGKKLELIEHITEDALSKKGLKSSTIFSIYEGKEANEDIIWIGTREAGVHVFSHSKNSFKQWDKILAKENSSAATSVFGICKDSFGDVWVGTYEGLFRINAHSNKHKKYLFSNINNRLNAHQAIFEDSEKNLWVGSNEGIFRYNRTADKFYKFPIPKIKDREPAVMKFLEDKNHSLWIGTGGYLMNIKGKTVRTFDKTPEGDMLSVAALEEDNKGNLWIGTYNGLVKFNLKTETFKTYKSDPNQPKSLINDLILSILYDKNGQLWVGSPKGLSKLVIENGKESFVHYTEKDGLPNSFVYATLADDKGRIWMSTNNGISCFDPAHKTFQNYSSDDGLSNREFNSGAYFQTKSGEIFFGGLGVMVSFHPLHMTSNKHLPKTVITSFMKFEKEQNLDSLLMKDGKIHLNYDENFFAFRFASLDYTNPEKNQIAYKLENFDKDWVYYGTRRYINFTNLRAGNYLLKIKSANNQGFWNEKDILAIPISIAPPFWQKWWFYLLSAFVLGTIIMTIYRSRVNRILEIERVKLEENERVRKIAAQDMHDEFGNSLTRISLLTELIKNKLKKAESEEALVLLSKIGDNASRLYQGTKDFIWAINPEHDNMFEIAIRIKDFCDEILDNRDMRFICEGISETFANIKLPMGASRHLVMLFKEAIMNTLKHANATEVKLNFRIDGKKLYICWQDNGIGIQANKPNNGNGLGNIRSRAEKIGALVEIISKNNEGTTVKLIIDKIKI
ncbi:ligand-binding sensor domain-containing protein [Emticicia sp. 17c]|uniref:ligand-binding sensor domain-containing protein n=1 Tax=Emticicia sp. 17c TaxID=3127704 RepID=UPI00301BB6F2